MIRNNGVFAFDTATDELDTLTANLVELCFAVKPGKVAYLLLGQDDLNEQHKLDRTAVLTAPKPILEDPTISKIGFNNLKFDQVILNQYNIHLAGITFDTILESYVLNSVAGNHDIASLANRFLQYTTVNFENIAVDKDQLMFNYSALEQTITYAAQADIILRLHQTLWPRLEQAAELKNVFEQIEIPLVPVLSRIERNGVLIDEQFLAKYSLELTKRLE